MLVALALLAPTASGGTQQSLQVGLSEWSVVPSAGVVPSGPLQITIRNYGLVVHQLDIFRTAVWAQRLPVRRGRAIGQEAAPPVDVPPGQTRLIQVRLAAGFYLLLDNLRGHYALGAEVPLIVV
jgi:hypothetical protein